MLKPMFLISCAALALASCGKAPSEPEPVTQASAAPAAALTPAEKEAFIKEIQATTSAQMAYELALKAPNEELKAMAQARATDIVSGKLKEEK